MADASALSLQPVVQHSTPMVIAARVRGAIARGDFPPGAQLYEAELARQLGVSRGPLREGLQRLTQEGLLVSIRHRGLFVVELTPDNVRDMYLAREAIERCAIAVVTERDPIGTSDALQEVLDDMALAADRHDARGLAEADIRFHEVLVDRTGSERLARVHGTQATEARICIQALGYSHDDGIVRLEEHQRIADAIRTANSALAQDLLGRHMADAVAELTGPARAPG